MWSFLFIKPFNLVYLNCALPGCLIKKHVSVCTEYEYESQTNCWLLQENFKMIICGALVFFSTLINIENIYLRYYNEKASKSLYYSAFIKCQKTSLKQLLKVERQTFVYNLVICTENSCKLKLTNI